MLKIDRKKFEIFKKSILLRFFSEMRGEYGMLLAVAYVQGSPDLSLIHVRSVSARC